jgi:hypothetical protein
MTYRVVVNADRVAKEAGATEAFDPSARYAALTLTFSKRDEAGDAGGGSLMLFLLAMGGWAGENEGCKEGEKCSRAMTMDSRPRPSLLETPSSIGKSNPTL